MLRTQQPLASLMKEKFKAIKDWPEISLSDADIQKLREIPEYSDPEITTIKQHSIQTSIPPTNHSIMPAQYLLYAVCVKEYALLLKKYNDAIDEARANVSPIQRVCDVIAGTHPYTFTTLDDYSKTIVLNPFNTSSSDSFEGKGFCSGTPIKPRGTIDYFGSQVVNVINVPAASSEILGKLIYYFTKQPAVYRYFEQKLLTKIPFHTMADKTKLFAYNVLTFLYQYDDLARLKPYIRINTDPNFSSIEYECKTLTSIFFNTASPFLPSDIGRAPGQKRCFPDPLYIDESGNFLYVSTEWTDGTGSRLDLADFQYIIEYLYPEFRIVRKDEMYYLENAISESTNANSFGSTFDISAASHGDLAFKYRNILLKGVPGTGKSHLIDKIITEKLLLAKNDTNILRINIHSASSNADLMQGIGISTRDDAIIYKEKQGLILNHIKKAIQNPQQPFAIVLEEIQENSLNELIGDLIYLIEDSKRTDLRSEAGKSFKDEEEFLTDFIRSNPNTYYVEIPYLVSTETRYKKMIIPNNLYIFCTSNYRDDKKIIEDNLLRRFEVIEIFPAYKDTVGTDFHNQDVSDFLQNLNEKIVTHFSDRGEIHPDRFIIGQAVWMKVSNETEFYAALLKVVTEFKDIRELEYSSDLKPILSGTDPYPFSIVKADLLKKNYKELIDHLQKICYSDLLS